MSNLAPSSLPNADLSPQPSRRRKFLAVVDESPESRIAARFAAGRAAHMTGGGLILFHVIPPANFQHWVAVADTMREEAMADAYDMMERRADEIRAYSGIEPEIVVREGQPKEALRDYIAACDDLFALILGAGTEGDPGPLVEYFSGPLAGTLQCPVVIVPGGLSAEDIDAMV
ncbi:nucleotide-binding universal stress UspA family protein [Rhodothalassium salexigens DSM 2132]|uniref:Nucleotide-binding universal stress UspA family protein n=1 Tax=Rhodothalassium salexigens DSM 2132 TaxID=1188247 RepID=A0A4R2PLD3_RHOSA|nr:universal stress protein [Rhodothalassium salexigens]MBB4211087.1 nucleotide-binding universal stress UspA family protein [Rhodothalassium salexigens DSM 2132]MBK1639995.1 hypothetical protein [Rhodothalassium salexigens DSM 2132]TCP36257.1 nucleotide-binding universal stress UspA family protein [Rhodothalassium salexigens DSM 2132]